MSRLGALAAVFALVLSGCTTRELIVLLPGQDGETGTLAVSRAGEAPVVLDQPLAGARVSGLGNVRAARVERADIERELAGAHQAMPKPAASYVVYFEFGTTDLTAESEASLGAALADLRDRPGAEIEVIGHTDRVGTVKRNDRLSVGRARVIEQRLLGHAVDGALITVSGRGEREPLEPTADEVRKPKNRRVEIVVR